MVRYFVGFGVGTSLGIVAGIITGKVIPIRLLMSPVLNFLRSIPSIALLPLAIVWFGIGEQEKFFLVSWGVFFPVWLNTHIGIVSVEKEFIWAAQSLGSNRLDLIRFVYLPRAVPSIVAGSRIAISTGFFALAAAEMSGAFNGIAFRIFNSHQMFLTDKMMVSIFTIGILSIAFDKFFVALINYLIPWWRVTGLNNGA